MHILALKMLHIIMQHDLPTKTDIQQWLKTYTYKEQLFLLQHYIHWYKPFKNEPYYIRENYFDQLLMHLYPNYNLNERKQLILFYTLISYNGQYPTPNNFLDLYHAAALDTTHLEIQYIIYQNELKLLGFFNAADELYTIIDKIKNYPKEITTYAQNFELPSF